jgi:hypothetical protein
MDVLAVALRKIPLVAIAAYLLIGGLATAVSCLAHVLLEPNFAQRDPFLSELIGVADSSLMVWETSRHGSREITIARADRYGLEWATRHGCFTSLPWWLPMEDVALVRSGEADWINVRGLGWPFPTVLGSTLPPVKLKTPNQPPDPRDLTITLCVSGLISNIAIFASLALFGTYCLRVALRRSRRKAGLCPYCAHTLGSTLFCTECGRRP